MKRWIIIFVGIVAFVVAWVLAGLVIDRVTVKEQRIDTMGSDPVVRERGPIPKALGLTFPDELPPLTFKCASLVVSDDVKQWKTKNADAVVIASAKNKALRERVTLPLEIIRGREDTNSVAITVDTGTVGAVGISDILDIARYYDISVTFFVTGCWALENPELTQRIMEEGHTLGAHSLTHLDLSDADEGNVARELDETTRIIEETTGVAPVLFRKPKYAGGDSVTVAAGERGMISVQGWPDLGDTTGWRSSVDAAGVRERVKDHTEAGAIWVMHNLSLDDLKAFEGVVRELLIDGYNLVRVEDLI